MIYYLDKIVTIKGFLLISMISHFYLTLTFLSFNILIK